MKLDQYGHPLRVDGNFVYEVFDSPQAEASYFAAQKAQSKAKA